MNQIKPQTPLIICTKKYICLWAKEKKRKSASKYDRVARVQITWSIINLLFGSREKGRKEKRGRENGIKRQLFFV